MRIRRGRTYGPQLYQTEGRVTHAHSGWTYVRTRKFFPVKHIKLARSRSPIIGLSSRRLREELRGDVMPWYYLHTLYLSTVQCDGVVMRHIYVHFGRK